MPSGQPAPSRPDPLGERDGPPEPCRRSGPHRRGRQIYPTRTPTNPASPALTHGGITASASGHLGGQRKNSRASAHLLDGYNGIIVPGGFGERGTEGMIAAAMPAKKNVLSGHHLGMQMAVIEAARSLAGMPDAGSEEFDHEGRRDPLYPRRLSPQGMGAGQLHRPAQALSDGKGRHDAAGRCCYGSGTRLEFPTSYGGALEIEDLPPPPLPRSHRRSENLSRKAVTGRAPAVDRASRNHQFSA